MNQQAFRIIGSKRDLEEIRQELLADPNLSGLHISEATAQSTGSGPKPTRQIELYELFLMQLPLEIAAALAAHCVYDAGHRAWNRLKKWTTRVQVEEIRQSDSGPV
jgi:hypothetical protein